MNTELFGELHEQEEYGLFGKEHQRQQCFLYSVSDRTSSNKYSTTMKEKIREILWNFVAGDVTDTEAVQQVLDLFAVSGSLPTLEDATKVAVRISEEAITPPLDAKEQAMFIAGFQECIKWLNVVFGNDG